MHTNAILTKKFVHHHNEADIDPKLLQLADLTMKFDSKLLKCDTFIAKVGMRAPTTKITGLDSNDAEV